MCGLCVVLGSITPVSLGRGQTRVRVEQDPPHGQQWSPYMTSLLLAILTTPQLYSHHKCLGNICFFVILHSILHGIKSLSTSGGRFHNVPNRQESTPCPGST